MESLEPTEQEVMKAFELVKRLLPSTNCREGILLAAIILTVVRQAFNEDTDSLLKGTRWFMDGLLAEEDPDGIRH